MSVKCKKVDSKFVYLLSLKILSYLRLISGVLMVNYHSNLFYNKKKRRSKIQTNFAAKNGHYPIFKLTYEIHYKSRKIVRSERISLLLKRFQIECCRFKAILMRITIRNKKQN